MVSCSKPIHIVEIHVISPDFIGKKIMDELPSCVCLAVLKKVHNSRPKSEVFLGWQSC